MQHASWTEKDQQLHLALLPSRVVTRHPSSPSSLFPQKKAFSLFVSELLAHTKGLRYHWRRLQTDSAWTSKSLSLLYPCLRHPGPSCLCYHDLYTLLLTIIRPGVVEAVLDGYSFRSTMFSISRSHTNS